MLLALSVLMFRSCLVAPLSLYCALLWTDVAAQSWQSLDDIRTAAVEHVRADLPPGGAKRSVEAGVIDTRLRLPVCAAPLAAFTPTGVKPGANRTVGVRCLGPQPWKIYVSVRVSTRDRVLVASRPIARDAVLGSDDVRYEERDLDLLPYGYMMDAAHVAGMRLRRPAAAGDVITPSMIANAPVVARGQQVTLEAADASVHIRMAGEALGEATVGQRVRVKNLSSARIVEGIVRSPEVVEVLLR
jgi:flagella basal body P-ring formation protein FlgA